MLSDTYYSCELKIPNFEVMACYKHIFIMLMA